VEIEKESLKSMVEGKMDFPVLFRLKNRPTEKSNGLSRPGTGKNSTSTA
jgi:hypothetical protein